MLVPVFGLHFLITIYRIQSYLHQIINLILDGLQASDFKFQILKICLGIRLDTSFYILT